MEPSVYALLCDLIGDDPESEVENRLTLEQAAKCARPGQVVAARRGQRKFCVVRLVDGRLFAVPDHCPHDGALLSDGFVEGNRLVCARHGWEFDLDSGTCPMRSGIGIDVIKLGKSS